MKKERFPSKNGIGYDIIKDYILGENTWVFTIWREIVKILGKVCLASFYLSFVLFMYSFFFDTCKLYYVVYKDKLITTIMINVGLIVSFNVIFNYTFASFLPPGTTDFFKSYTNEDYENLKSRLNNENLNVCKKCNTFKPERTHHCSICRKCTLRKDHHNAWINNCVGYHNQRYFLLFLFYFLVMLAGYLGLSIQLITEEQFIALKPERTTIFPYVFIGSIVYVSIALVFSLWQFFLLFKGETTYEFLERKLDKYKDEKYKKKSKVKETFYELFGTHWIFLVFFPSIRKLPYDGIVWDPNQEISIQYITVNHVNNTDSDLGVLNE